MTSKKLACRHTVITILLAFALTLSMSTMLIQKTNAQTTHYVTISGFAFIPQNITIQPGFTVVWNNTDPVIHTLWFVFAANGSTYLLSDPIPPNTTWNYTFNDAALELQCYSFDKLWITGFVIVTILGDVNGDRVVDGSDVVIVIEHVPSFPGHPKWDPNSDVNGDGVVDGSDVVIVIEQVPSYW